MLDLVAGVQVNGDYFTRRKLTPQQRDDIRQRYAAGETQRDLAEAYGVSVSTIKANVSARHPGAMTGARWL